MRVAAIILSTDTPTIIPFAEACLRFSPQISLKRPGTLFIEIGKCRLLYREETFLQRVQVLLGRFDLKAKIAIGNTLLDALVSAQYGTLDPKKLDLTCFVDFLDPFRTDSDSSRIAEEIAENLNQVGITTVAQFLELPVSEIAWRFGAAGIFLRSRIENEREVGWPLWVPEEKIREKLELDEAEQFGGIESLIYYLKPVLERVFARLWGRGLRAASVKIKLNLEKFSTIKEPVREWNIAFIFPQSTARGTLPILSERLNLDLAKKPLESTVNSIEFEVLQAVRDYRKQRNLFDSKDDTDEVFNSALSQLVEGMGRDKVFRAHIHEEAVAERSWSKNFIDQKDLPDLSNYIPLRPTKLLSKPELVQLAHDKIFIRKRPYRILRWSCVEQIATHWIDKEIVRSYYRLTIDGKPPVWIFRGTQDEYYLHGYFG